MKREYDFRQGKRGAVVRTPKNRTRITVRPNSEILEWFRELVNQAGGGKPSNLINNALRQHIGRSDEPIEKTLRRVMRQELGRAN
jgi:uncharacterized protein (DUF4415 family)